MASTEAPSEISAKSCFLISRVNSLDARFNKTQPYDDFFVGIFVRGIQRFPFIAALCGVALMLKFSFIIFICRSFFLFQAKRFHNSFPQYNPKLLYRCSYFLPAGPGGAGGPGGP